MKKFFIQFIFFTLIIIAYIYVNTDNTKYSLRKLVSNHNSCNPINETYVPFKIKINGTQYPMHISPYLNKSINFKCLNKAKKQKVILFWNKFWAWNEFGVGKDEIFIKNKCPVTNCEITTDKLRVNESDFVVVDGGNMESPPSFRPKNQRFSFTFLYLSYNYIVLGRC